MIQAMDQTSDQPGWLEQIQSLVLSCHSQQRASPALASHMFGFMDAWLCICSRCTHPDAEHTAWLNPLEAVQAAAPWEASKSTLALAQHCRGGLHVRPVSPTRAVHSQTACCLSQAVQSPSGPTLNPIVRVQTGLLR